MSIENKKIEATLSLNNDYVVTGLQDRKALSLVTSEGPVLNLAICGENKEYIFCLITEQNLIYINNTKFLDYEEINDEDTLIDVIPMH